MAASEAFATPLYVTQPVLPDLEETYKTIEAIWQNKQLSNNGPMVKQLEKELADFLGVKYLSVLCNGTTSLQIACKALKLTGEVITTPFTFSATIHSLAWNNLKPVFCDIEEDTFNINPDLIEPLITQETTAILPVHVFGNPCKVEKIQQIADKYGLKVLYDAAHAFGVKLREKPIGTFGDISMFSFHATKVYHTIEGGALTCHQADLKERIDSLRNYCQKDDIFPEPGTNAKLNEVQAGIGLLVLKKVEEEIQKRKKLTNLYRQLLSDIPGITLNRDIPGVTHNYPYFVIKVEPDEFGLNRDQLFLKLQEYNIFPRKYFFPLCSNFECYRNLPSASKSNLPVANKVADRVLALPLHGNLNTSDIVKICEIIKKIRQENLKSNRTN
ncbi:MAG TPA: DegT/DnrJ/EryC1/StrS family aminotransferase [Peptococcaceae bacterium]|nr:DegT/DnrJ/EryC1/StrS family aminotransferase [Peptococcaceae bacterium]